MVKNVTAFALLSLLLTGCANSDTVEIPSAAEIGFDYVFVGADKQPVRGMVNNDNLEKFFPVLYRMSGMVGFDILYIVIGGWLDAFLKDHPGLVPGLSRIRAIFPENKDVIQALRTDFKMSNVVWLPNFRICRFKPDFLQGDARPGNVQVSDERLIVKEKDFSNGFAGALCIADNCAEHGSKGGIFWIRQRNRIGG